MSIRVRFAPSPTGYLHLGGARTALFNLLYARRHGGSFLLRIEDSDQERSTPEHTSAILDALRWLSLEPDEPPVFQADHFERHRAQARSLIHQGLAYPVFADDFPDSSDPLNPLAARPSRPEIRNRAGLFGKHVGKVSTPELFREGAALLERMENEPHAVVFLVPEGETAWEDLVHGPMRFEHEHIEDFVLVRSDGTPLYNLACVSDDMEMGITHVLRGDDHIPNTPKQLLLYRALGGGAPEFGHLPMILGQDASRFSKRHGATSVQAYQARGILPEALVNYLAFLGWNPGDEREVLLLPDLVEAFSVERVQKKSAMFDPVKLEWLNSQYIQRLPVEVLTQRLRPYLSPRMLSWSGARPADFLLLVEQLQPRSKTLLEMAERAEPFAGGEAPPLPHEVEKAWKDKNHALRLLGFARQTLADAPAPESSAEAHDLLVQMAEAAGVGMGKLMPPLRLALTGALAGIGMDHTLYLLGRDVALARLDQALARLHTLAS